MRTERGQMRRSRRCHLRGAKFGESVESLEDASIRTSLLVQSVEGGECFAYLSLHDKWGCVGGRKICDLGRKIIPGNRHGGLLGRRQSRTLLDGSEGYRSLLGRRQIYGMLDGSNRHGGLLGRRQSRTLLDSSERCRRLLGRGQGRDLLRRAQNRGLLCGRQCCTLPDGSERYCSLLGRGRSRTLLDSREKHGALLLLDGCGDTARASTHS